MSVQPDVEREIEALVDRGLLGRFWCEPCEGWAYHPAGRVDEAEARRRHHDFHHAWPLVWRWWTRLPGRYGQRCRIVARGALNTVLVEFEDGFQVATSGWAVRRA